MTKLETTGLEYLQALLKQQESIDGYRELKVSFEDYEHVKKNAYLARKAFIQAVKEDGTITPLRALIKIQRAARQAREPKEWYPPRLELIKKDPQHD